MQFWQCMIENADRKLDKSKYIHEIRVLILDCSGRDTTWVFLRLCDLQVTLIPIECSCALFAMSTLILECYWVFHWFSIHFKTCQNQPNWVFLSLFSMSTLILECYWVFLWFSIHFKIYQNRRYLSPSQFNLGGTKGPQNPFVCSRNWVFFDRKRSHFNRISAA